MDVRRTKDGQFVIFHDADLKRIDGTTLSLKKLSLQELNQRLNQAKLPPVLTLSQLKHEYNQKLPIVLDLKLKQLPHSLVEMLDPLPFYFYLGVRTLSALAAVTSKWDRTRILALVPEPTAIEEFVESGAGIIRLWQDWLTQELVSKVRALDAEVWVMTGRSGSVGDTDEKALARILNLKVDGIILNDPRILLRCLSHHGSNDGVSEHCKRPNP